MSEHHAEAVSLLSLEACPPASMHDYDYSSTAHATRPLTQLGLNQWARVVSLAAGADISPDLLRRLTELGFLPGEHVRVIARGPWGGEPIAVRVGASTFGLRRQEADCIQIAPLE